jgi:hypothetical protein
MTDCNATQGSDYFLVTACSFYNPMMQTSPQQRRALQSKVMANSSITMENELKSSDGGSLSSSVLRSNTSNKTSREVKALALDTESSNYLVDIHHNSNDADDDNDNDDDNDGDDDETEPFDHNGLMHRSTNEERREYLKAKRMRRIKVWKESPFAIGLTEPTWIDERYRDYYDSRADFMPDESGCLCMSARVCPMFGASRVGNMAVLKSSQEWVEEVEYDDETNEPTTKRYTRPRLDIVVGPYWPMLVFVTYPLILGVSGWTFLSGILRPGTSIVLRFVWTVCTVTLIVSLTRTAFRDPGILYRQRKQKDSTWRWSDQADTYRPRHAWYDMDTAVVIEGFDHT